MSLLDNIQNYYETLVLEALAKEVQGQEYDEDVLIDILCVAVNHLPPRYIRHEVDFLYSMSPIEREEIQNKAQKAVKDAIAYIKNNSRP